MADDPLALLRPVRWPTAAPVVDTADLVEAAVIGALVALVLVGLLALVRRRGRTSPRAEAVARIKAAALLPPDARLMAEAAALRSYVAAVKSPEAATAEGEAWLSTLDGLFATTAFSSGPGRVLVEGLYGPAGAPADDAVGRLLSDVLAKSRA